MVAEYSCLIGCCVDRKSLPEGIASRIDSLQSVYRRDWVSVVGCWLLVVGCWLFDENAVLVMGAILGFRRGDAERLVPYSPCHRVSLLELNVTAYQSSASQFLTRCKFFQSGFLVSPSSILSDKSRWTCGSIAISCFATSMCFRTPV